jgi:hypothetical protein
MAQSIIWTTALVEQTIEKLRYGMDVDMGCFFKNEPELKDGGILFKHSRTEIDEFQKCGEDIVYFVENYCKFLTDKGRALVDLRSFQQEILNELADVDTFDEEIEEWLPKYKDYILMASRQTGKCLFNTSVIIKNKDLDKPVSIPLEFLYYLNKEKLTVIEKLKLKLLLLYHKLDKM